MTDRYAGDRLARLLLPYRCREMEAMGGPDHELGWWFAAAPPEVAQQALTLCQVVPGERPNGQPPEEWLVEQAAIRGGVLAGFAAPAGPASPRMNVDAIIVPSEQAVGLAEDVAKLWPLDDRGTALDLAIVEGLAQAGATQRMWGCPGPEFLAWRDGGDWRDAAFCSFWWD